jgi:hypothetical protein
MQKNGMFWKKEIKTSYALLAVFLLAAFVGSLLWIETHYYVPAEATFYKKIKKQFNELLAFTKIERPKPAPVSMNKLKKQGCVADGLLSEYNPEREDYIELINRSQCYYLHRAVETWLTPPDFETIDYVMNRITLKEVVYGMFLAEALRDNAEYFNTEEKREFSFKDMCQKDSAGTWGVHSCKADFGSGEYRAYLRQITRQAIDLGIQSFTFGQIYYQAGADERNRVEEVIKEMRAYAKKQKVKIVIGAQTGKITDRNFLALFDYIEGGVGIDAEGNLPEGPCLDRWGGCWALLWHSAYSQNAHNVLLHLDWSGIKSDDLDIFARMDRKTRAKTLQNLYAYFTKRDMGFLMPFFGVLDKENGGCRGPKKIYYSPDNKYSCKDEDAINKILVGE